MGILSMTSSMAGVNCDNCAIAAAGDGPPPSSYLTSQGGWIGADEADDADDDDGHTT